MKILDLSIRFLVIPIDAGLLASSNDHILCNNSGSSRSTEIYYNDKSRNLTVVLGQELREVRKLHCPQAICEAFIIKQRGCYFSGQNYCAISPQLRYMHLSDRLAGLCNPLQASAGRVTSKHKALREDRLVKTSLASIIRCFKRLDSIY